jgi:hypothetical protein
MLGQFKDGVYRIATSDGEMSMASSESIRTDDD